MLFRESHFENPQIPFPKKIEKSEKKSWILKLDTIVKFVYGVN